MPAQLTKTSTCEASQLESADDMATSKVALAVRHMSQMMLVRRGWERQVGNNLRLVLGYLLGDLLAPRLGRHVTLNAVPISLVHAKPKSSDVGRRAGRWRARVSEEETGKRRVTHAITWPFVES
jgi:hypothetical protein